MLLSTGEDGSETAAGHGLLRAVQSIIAGVFLPTIETQSRSWNSDELPNGSVKVDLVNSLSSFLHVLTSMPFCDLRSSLLVCVVSSDNFGLKVRHGQLRKKGELVWLTHGRRSKITLMISFYSPQIIKKMFLSQFCKSMLQHCVQKIINLQLAK